LLNETVIPESLLTQLDKNKKDKSTEKKVNISAKQFKMMGIIVEQSDLRDRKNPKAQLWGCAFGLV
jgi:hypothetical protein